MVQVQRVFTVARPVEAVVAYLRDFSTTESWDPGTVTCTRTDSGPIAVGSRWHNVSEFRGKKTELDYRLDTMEPDHLVFVGTNKTATSRDDLSFAAEGTGSTTITYLATITFNGLAKLADPFLRKEFERLGDEVVNTMTAAVEQQPA